MIEYIVFSFCLFIIENKPRVKWKSGYLMEWNELHGSNLATIECDTMIKLKNSRSDVFHYLYD